MRDIVGLPLLGAIAQLAPEGTGDADHLRMAEVYKETYHAKRTGGAVEPLMVGAKAAVERLDAAGYLLGVATGKGRRGMVGVLESHGLISRFVSLKCGDDGPGKPNPHMLRTVMDEAGARPEDTVMIGDTTFDLIMARAADVLDRGDLGLSPPPVLASEKPGRTVRFEDVFDAVGALIGPLSPFPKPYRRATNRTGRPEGSPRSSSSRITICPRITVAFGQPVTVVPSWGVQPQMLAIHSSSIVRVAARSTSVKSAS